jgi:hypothetical protein
MARWIYVDKGRFRKEAPFFVAPCRTEQGYVARSRRNRTAAPSAPTDGAALPRRVQSASTGSWFRLSVGFEPYGSGKSPTPHPYSPCTLPQPRLIAPLRRGVAQPGSAPALGAGCRRFESCLPDQLFPPHRSVIRHMTALQGTGAAGKRRFTGVRLFARSPPCRIAPKGRPRSPVCGSCSSRRARRSVG